MKKYIRLILFLTLYAFPQWVLACPGCKNALETEKAMALADGYYWSIMIMLSLPFCLTGLIAFLVYRSVQKKNKMTVNAVSSAASLQS
jgi:hypothetical protein